MSAHGRRTWQKAFPGDADERQPSAIGDSAHRGTSIGKDAPQRLAVVGLKYNRFDFLRSLPRACLGFLFCVMADAVVMVGYAAVLLATGVNTSAFYFAAIILASAAMLVYFSVSAIRSENTIELLATVALGTCVSATIFYFRANDNAFSAVQRR